jgi:hypothetical protein
MRILTLKPAQLWPMLLLLGALLVFTEYGGGMEGRGALLLTLVFWTMLVQGSIAVVAACELVGARWIASLRRELLSPYPLLLLFAALFLTLGPRIDLYPWAERPGPWLNAPFFLGRNCALLLLGYAAASAFARRALRRDERRVLFAVLYLLVFVVAQSFIAYDWVMSLEAPWISTLFGPYFFVEAFFGGLALAGGGFFLFWRRKLLAGEGTAQGHLQDLGLLLFGFSILWTGLFFAQFLLIWYGNLPEEVAYIARRLETLPRLTSAWLTLAGLFFVPFFGLMSQRAKRSPALIGCVSGAVLLGMFLEKLLFIRPVVPLHLGAALLQSALVFGVWLLMLYGQARQLPSDAEGE